MNINPEHLFSFVALVQTGSMSAAAKSRCLTQPAISNQLKRLQDTIGMPLYRRCGRGVQITGTGEAFYIHALTVQQSMQDLNSFAEALHGLTAGRVHVAASQTIAGSLLPSALVQFRRQYPDIEIFVDSGNSQQVFQHMQSHDIGLVESLLPEVAPDCCRVEMLGHDSIVVAMCPGHPLALNKAVGLRALQEYPLIWRESGSGTREALEQAWMIETGTRPEVHLCMGGVSAVLEAVRQGLGVGVVSQYCLPTGESVLITRPLQPPLRRPMSLLIPPNISPIAALVADFLRTYLKEKLEPL